MRLSNDEIIGGYVKNGFDYDLQVWVVDFTILNCGHPDRMRPGCCNGDLLQGQDIRQVKR